jgi:hypothetical protein
MDALDTYNKAVRDFKLALSERRPGSTQTIAGGQTGTILSTLPALT